MKAGAEKGANFLNLIAGVAPELHGRTIPATASGFHYTTPEPWGIVGMICAYNHPTLFTCMKMAPALMAGNAVILKPAVQTPLSPLALAALTDDLFPPGLFNVVAGGAETGQAIVMHPEILRISFTGSMPTGQKVYKAAADSGRFKSVTLELGGKNPIVIFGDVDPDDAAAAVIKGTNFARVGGQSCGATSRLLIHEDMPRGCNGSRGGQTLPPSVRTPRRPRHGDGLHGVPRPPATGCCRHGRQSGVEQGARLLAGGGRPRRPGPWQTARTSCRRSSIGVDPDMPGCSGRRCSDPCSPPRRGPTRQRHSTLPMTRNTGSPPACGATTSTERSTPPARCRPGYIWVNDVEVRYPGMPFGGWKQSGLGLELGLVDDILSHTRSKSMNIGLRSPR